MSSNENDTQGQSASVTLLVKMLNKERQDIMRDVEYGWGVDATQYNKLRDALRKDGVDMERYQPQD